MYKTKGGSIVQLFDADCGGEKPLVGIYYEPVDKAWYAAQWTLQGHYRVMNGEYIPSSLDLENPPKFEKLVFEDEAA